MTVFHTASTLLCALWLLAAWPATAGKVSSLWVFGDDYLDIGTGQYTPLLRTCAASPYGQNLGGPTGRCSNGNVLTDYLSKQMKLAIGPYSGPEAFQVNGVSFAAAGAGALPETNSKGTVSLDKQRKQFEEYISKKGLENKLNQSFIVISFGMNDYLQAIMVGKDPMAYVDRVLRKTVDLIKSINKVSGAYRFIVLGMPALGCLPLVRQRFFAPPDVCLTNLNAVNEHHERRLSYALDTLISQQPQGSPIFYSMFLLSAASLDTAMGYPAFTKKLDLACGMLDDKNAIIGCGQNVTYVEDGVEKSAPVGPPKMSGYDYFWWDWLNPTENAFYTFWVGMWMGANAKLVYPMSVLRLSFT